MNEIRTGLTFGFPLSFFESPARNGKHRWFCLDSLAIPIVRMSPPVAAYGLVILVRRSISGAIALASLGLPIAPDLDVFSATAILLTGLI